MNRIHYAGLSLSTVFLTGFAAHSTHEALNPHDYAAEHNQKVNTCAKQLGPRAVSAAMPPADCLDFANTFEYHIVSEGDNRRQERILPAASDFVEENYWTEDNNRKIQNMNKVAAVLFDAGFVAMCVMLRRRRSAQQESGQLTNQREESTLDQLNREYFALLDKDLDSK